MFGRFRELRHIRHAKNIGGLANYVRAIELASAEYAWVLTDDDHFEFDCEDVLSKLEASSVDVVSVGLAEHRTPGGFRGGARELAEKAPFFFEHSLVSTLIFKTSLYTTDLIRAAYDSIYTMFPHFPFLVSLVERDVPIYTARRKMIAAGVNLGYSAFAYLRGWLQSVQNIPDKSIRGLAYRDVFKGRSYWHILLFSILVERAYRPEKYRKDYIQLVRAACGTGLIPLGKVLTVFPLVFMPRFAHSVLWRNYVNYRTAKGKPLPNFDEDR
jgi:hypothetical protein